MLSWLLLGHAVSRDSRRTSSLDRPLPFSIHGCSRICSREGRSDGRIANIHLIRSSHSVTIRGKELVSFMSDAMATIHKYKNEQENYKARLAMRQYTPFDIRLLKYTSPLQISLSRSKGMSPQTMSYSRMPSDQTVAERPW